MKRAKVGAIILILANAVVWGVPTAIYLMLVWYQFAHGNWTLLLIFLGPAEYGLGLILSVFYPAVLVRRGNASGAIIACVVGLVVGIPFAAWGILMLGST
jgi:hypothetical protein